MIGLGYHATITPPVIRRNVLEDPSWYTAYTPYQPEISQGRLEALLNFQTVIGDLTGLPTANASLLDEGTAAAEAMTLVRRGNRKASGPFVVDADALPQTIDVVRTRAEAMGIEVVVADLDRRAAGRSSCAACWCSTPAPPAGSSTRARVIEQAHERDALAVVAADLLALTLLESPGALGADVVVGSSQRFGVPLFYGGPHAGYMSVAAGLERHLPGRLVGVSVDAEGRPAYRLALQTREQHIRRDKATSNICTAQVLLAVVGVDVRRLPRPRGAAVDRDRAPTGTPRVLAAALRRRRASTSRTTAFFDTLTVPVPGRAADDRRRRAHARPAAAADRRRPRRHHHLGGARTRSTICSVLHRRSASPASTSTRSTGHGRRAARRRCAAPPTYLTHEVFPAHHSETAMLRYLRRLSAPRLRAGPRHDPARLLHDEAQRDHRDGAGLAAGLRRPAPVRAGRGRRRLPPAGQRARGLAGRGHRLRPGLDPAQRRLAGRARRACSRSAATTAPTATPPATSA